MRIAGEIWDALKTQDHDPQTQNPIHADLTTIRNDSPLQQLLLQQPQVETWITRPYDMREIRHTILHLQNNKATGTDGIPGEIYEILHKHLIDFILQIMNQITHGVAVPGKWTEGAIVHIRKNSKQECANYRPIFLTQIIYKIWPRLQPSRLARILHLATPSTQYGYKNGLSAIDAIIKLEHAIKTGPDNLAIVLMDISKAFECVNRTLLWTTLYKKLIPTSTTQHIRQGHQNTTLRNKDNGQYGPPVKTTLGGISSLSTKCATIHHIT